MSVISPFGSWKIECDPLIAARWAADVNGRLIKTVFGWKSSPKSVSESKIMKAIEELSDHLTLIIVAHRVSTLHQCDLILDLSSKDDANKVKSYEDIIS